LLIITLFIKGNIGKVFRCYIARL